MKSIILSLIVPGAGQAVQGRWLWAIGFMVLSGLLFMAGTGLFGNLIAAVHAAWGEAAKGKAATKPAEKPTAAVLPQGSVVNLTQHAATPEQVSAGVIDLKGDDAVALKEHLTFKELPSHEEIVAAAIAIAQLADHVGAKTAMIGGAPFLMGPLEHSLRARGITPVFAFSKRESVDEPLPDGGVRKTAVFKHAGFVGA
jgi:hypothetical protein